MTKGFRRPPAGTAGVSRNPGQSAQGYSLDEARAAVQEAERFRLTGKLDKARTTCLSVLRQYPDFVAALHTLGLTLADNAEYERALNNLHRASMLNPHDANTLTALGGVYLRMGFSEVAARSMEHALKLAPDNAAIHATLGEIYREEKEYEYSCQAYERALELDPSFTAAEVGLARCCDHIGDLQCAAAIYNKMVASGSRSISALYMLSQLPSDLIEFDVLALLDEAASDPRTMAKPASQKQLGFARATALDKAGRHEEAWKEIVAVRKTERREHHQTYQKRRALYDRVRELMASEDMAPIAPCDDVPDLPLSLFIVGPSRSGKTTLERLVGGLDGVKRGYENPIVENGVRRAFKASGFPTRSRPLELPAGLSKPFRDYYVEELRERAASARVFTNTLPSRNEDALRIASCLPNTRFVFVRRDVEDLTIRIYMRNYKSGNEYAWNIEDIRHYLDWCHAMMGIMAARMPDNAIVINYEDMVADPDAALAKTAGLCGLEVRDTAPAIVGDDRGCGQPYAAFVRSALEQRRAA
ncbi:MAG: sulfotransferase [bacterium]